MLLAIIIYVLAGGVMWLVASQMAPVGREIKFSRAFITVILMALGTAATTYWLLPLIGAWKLIGDFLIWTIIVRLMLELPFWRSLVAVLIYLIVVVSATIVIGLIAKSSAASSGQRAALAKPLSQGVMRPPLS